MFREAPGITGTLGKCLLSRNEEASWRGRAFTAHPLKMLKFALSCGLARQDEGALILLTNLAASTYS